MAETVGSIQYDIDVQTGDLLNAEKQVDKTADRMVNDFNRVEKSTKNLNAQVKKTSTAVRTGLAGAGRSAGQAGIQIQQFVGQVQGGQSALVAFSQQAADLGIVLGAPLVGAIVGIAAALSGPLIAAISDTNDAFDELEVNSEEWIENIRDRLKEAGADTEIFANIVLVEVGKLNSEYDRNARKIRELADEQSRLFKLAQEDADQRQKAIGQAAKLALEIEKLTEKNKELAASIETVSNLATENLGIEGFGSGTEQIDNVNKAIKALERQADVLGKNRIELAEYAKAETLAELATDGATDAQLDQAEAAFDQIIAFEKLASAKREEAKAERERQQAEAGAGRFVTGILARGQSPEEKVRAEFDKLNELREQDLIKEEDYQRTKLELQRQYSERRQQVLEDDANNQLQNQIEILSLTADLFDGLAGLTSAFAGEQSAAYKALFAISKTFAIAEATLKLQLAVANAAALPFPANLPAITEAAALGSSILSSMQSVTFGGGRQFGGPVQAGNLYRFGEGGEPEIYQANGKNYMLPGENGTVLSNDQAFGSPTININNMAPGVEVEPTVSNDGKVIDIAVKRAVGEVSRQINSGQGQVSRAMRSGTNTTFRAGSR